MANYLSHFQTIKNSSDRIVIAVEDVCDLWPTIKESFESRIPFRNATLNNKTRNLVTVENLFAEYILTTDARLRSRSPHEQALLWFREPYATVVLVTCEDLDEFKNILKPRLKLIVQSDEREWFIVFASKASPSNESATKMAKKVYYKIEVDFNTRKRDRCCKYDLQFPEANFWDDLESKIMECVRNTLERRLQFYEDEIRKLSEQRFMPVWSFCNFFILKESLASMFEMAGLNEDALREYDELELCYMDTVGMGGKLKEFGGLERGDDQAALLDPCRKLLTEFVQNDSFREFEFRQYLFSCQAKLLFKLNRAFDFAHRGHTFVISFSKALSLHENILPFCMKEVWVISASLALVNACTSLYKNELVAPDKEKEFHRQLGDLYSMCRVKFMRLAFLIGFGNDIERSPINSAMLSFLPWPKPAVWPSLSPEASAQVILKEKVILQTKSRIKHFGIYSKNLPLEPSNLLREANRRRASLSAGNLLEMLDSRGSPGGGLADSLPKSSTSIKNAPMMSRTNSSPGDFENSVDRPMKLAEIHVAAEHSLRNTISDDKLWASFSSLENFEKKYLELTKGAAENYHRSWWRRHGVVLDGETAAVYFKHQKFDLAAKLYEKVCALYSGEGWQELLADVLPNLAECQNRLNDKAGYLLSCVKLLSIDKSLFLNKERQAFQAEVVRLAYSDMENPVPLDLSSLLTFSGDSGAPLTLCDGDSGMLTAIVWSGFPDEITLDHLSLTLIDTFNTDEGVKGLQSPCAVVLSPGKNNMTLPLPPQNPGSYVLGVLTGQLGHLKVRSHSFFKGSPAESDDFMVYEKPARPILKVLKPRPLVDLSAANSSALLMNETQWVGILIRPIDYSLKGAVLRVDTGPGLKIDESCAIEIESDCSNISTSSETCEQLSLDNCEVTLPAWASEISSNLWIPVCASSDALPRVASPVSTQKQNMVDGLRTVALKLRFGMSHNQIYERTLAVHFTDPFHVSTRIMDKCKDGNMLLQVILHSQIMSALTIHDSWIELQDGFSHCGQEDGRPISCLFPLVASPASKLGIFFAVRLNNSNIQGAKDKLKAETIVNFRYGISGNRAKGAHSPVPKDSEELMFKSIMILKKPILHPFLGVGFVPFPADSLRVGKLVTVQWRIERLRVPSDDDLVTHKDEFAYEINASTENWMIAGRRKGRASLAREEGSRMMISVVCMPLVAGYVRPPHIALADVDEANISCNPPAPHLVCVMPPPLTSSFCVPSSFSLPASLS